ncbi:hypothetical protein [Gimesia sp.]|uniref:hypothetical protein n=1 Tax=Gimesia sp. TaxID=2024833 RepID=UPI000C5C2DD2|nr:hypothetical protein [Gimesia sp.]MAX40971.1 hypothetical protein [Gimesia sp.]HAH46841.1 hypothetical protein [Planctomycetaceae bacterium]HBL42748.1 hypothetical protein [Planctomycetaceae bacterium]
MTTAALSKPKAGRPKGSKTEQLPIVDFVLPQCSKCKSSERTGYNNVKTRASSGIAPDGYPYNFVSRKRTSCRNCGQRRIDVYYEYVI